MAKASPTQAWLWHQRLSYLNFDTINLLFKKDIVNGLPQLKYVKDQLCSSCKLGKEKRSTFKTKTVPSSKGRLNLLHKDLCGPMRIESINGKKYILVIFYDYSRYTWTHFLRSKDETPKVLKDFLKMIQWNLQAYVITVQTDRGRKFLNKTLRAYFKEEEMSKASDYDNSDPAPQLQKASDHNRSELDIQDHNNELSSSKLVSNVYPSANTDAPSLQELDLLFNSLYKEFFIAGNSSVSKSFALSDNYTHQDTQPIANIQPTIEPITPTTTVHAEESNDNQEADAQFELYEFINPFCTPVQEVVKSSSCNVDTSNMHTFYQRHRSNYH
ncbi:retrovirus-related pol polyprotein from transposon TNT 1-94 [Tanacetum coccineum]